MMPTGHRTVLPRGVNSILVSDLQLARNRSRLGLGEADNDRYILSVLALRECASQAAFGCDLGTFCCELHSWSRS